MLRPKTTEEVSAIMKYCNEKVLAVCPQGGNTGLVGGSVPVFDEVVLSTQLMNQIYNIDELTGELLLNLMMRFNAYLYGLPMICYRRFGVSIGLCLGNTRESSIREGTVYAVRSGSEGNV